MRVGKGIVLIASAAFVAGYSMAKRSTSGELGLVPSGEADDLQRDVQRPTTPREGRVEPSSVSDPASSDGEAVWVVWSGQNSPAPDSISGKLRKSAVDADATLGLPRLWLTPDL